MRRFLYWYFGINSESHRQIYYGARQYPLLMIHSLVVGFLGGVVTGVALSLVL